MIVLLAEQTTPDWLAIGGFALLTLVAGGFLLFTSVMTCRLVVPDRVKKVATGMNRLLLVVPLLAVPVFAALFLFVLKGRLYERACHATLVLALWLYSARFYWFLISFFKHKRILAFSIIGMIVSAALAVYLTPLDRYVAALQSFLGQASILPGIVLLLFFYVAAFFTTCANKNKLRSELWWDMWWF